MYVIVYTDPNVTQCCFVNYSNNKVIAVLPAGLQADELLDELRTRGEVTFSACATQAQFNMYLPNAQGFCINGDS